MRSAPRCIERGGCELWVVTSPCEVRKCFKGENSCHGNVWFRSLSESKNNNCHCKDKQVKLILVQFILNFIFFYLSSSGTIKFPEFSLICYYSNFSEKSQSRNSCAGMLALCICICSVWPCGVCSVAADVKFDLWLCWKQHRACDVSSVKDRGRQLN